jgi:hypothetical protein
MSPDVAPNAVATAAWIAAAPAWKHGAVPRRATMRPCNCGSGLPSCAEYDARGIYLTRVCEQCQAEKLSHFRPDVLTDPDYPTDEPIEEDE